MHIILNRHAFLVYVKLYLGIYDLDRGRVWRDYWKNGGSDKRGTGFCGRCSFTLYYNDRCDGIMGRFDGDCTKVGTHCKIDTWNTTLYSISVSADSGGASGKGIYCN